MKQASAARILIRFGAVLTCLTLLLSLAGCIREDDPVLVSKFDCYDPYPQLAITALPGYSTVYRDGSLFSALNHGGVVECFDAQAIPAIIQGVGEYWYPQCLATVVIVLDREQTDAVITGWRGLFASGLPTSWNGILSQQQLILAALAFGLDGRLDYNIDAALAAMRQQFEAGNLFQGSWDTPAMVCFDYQAVSLMEEGRDLEIIIPSEGTFSFTMGLLSNHILSTVSDEILLEGGMRLVDERCTNPFYPPYESYHSAVRPDSFQYLLDQTSHIIKDVRREVRSTRLYTSADGVEDILVSLVGVILALIWMKTAIHRAIRPDIQRAIRLTAILVVGWLLLRLFKYQLYQRGALNRMLGYCYYIFEIALPLNTLYISSIFDKPESDGRPPRWFLPFLAAYPVLVGLVLTNDLHHLVFYFQPNSTWPLAYSYGPLYYVIFIFCVMTFPLSILMLMRKSWNNVHRVDWYLPTLLGLLIILYAILHSTGSPVSHNSDFSITACFFSILFFEAALRTGLIPANTHYGLLFSSSPLDMQLLDREGRTALASSSAAPLEPVLRVQLQSHPSVCVSRDPDTLLYSRAIHGGTVVWQEDISTLNHLYQDIQASVARLEAANGLLRREGQIIRQKVAADVKADLFNSLAREIQEKTTQLAQAIQDLPAAEDRERQIACITLLLCHIKRRCNLFFLTQEGRNMDGDELAMYLDELSEFGGYAGVKALTRCGVSGPMDIRTATLCYDFYFSVLDWSVRLSRATLLGQLSPQGDCLSFSILSSETAEGLAFSASFRAAVEEAGGSVFCKKLEETAGIYLTFPKGGTKLG